MITFWRKQMAEYKSNRTNNDNMQNNNDYPYSQYECECCHCKKIFMMLVLLILTFMAGIMVGNCTSRPYMTSYPYGPHLVKQYEHMKHKKFHKGMHEVAPNTAQQNTPDMPNQAVEGYIVEINQTN